MCQNIMMNVKLDMRTICHSANIFSTISVDVLLPAKVFLNVYCFRESQKCSLSLSLSLSDLRNKQLINTSGDNILYMCVSDLHKIIKESIQEKYFGR